jgi:PAS domain S-box-containing protein
VVDLVTLLGTLGFIAILKLNRKFLTLLLVLTGAIEELSQGSLSQTAEATLLALLAASPYLRDKNTAEELFRRASPTWPFLFFSMLTAPLLLKILIEIALHSAAQTVDLTVTILQPAIQSALQMSLSAPVLFLATTHFLSKKNRSPPQKLQKLKIAIFTLLTVLLSLAIFGPLLPHDYRSLPLVYTLFPPLIASAITLSPSHHSIHLLTIAAIAVIGERLGYGPYHVAPEHLTLLLPEAYLLTLIFTTWTLCILKQEARYLHGELKERFSTSTQQLTGSELFLDTLIENIPDMIFVKDATDLKFVRINRAAESLLGIPKSLLLGRDDYAFFPKDQADHFTQTDRQVLTSHRMTEIEECITTQNQGLRWLKTKKIPILAEDRTPKFLLGISEDITMKREAEHHRARLLIEEAARREAEKSLAQRNEFLSLAAHELRTPVAALKLSLELSHRALSKLKPETQAAWGEMPFKPLLEIGRQEVLQLERLTENLLDASRIHEKRFQLHLKPNEDLSAVVRLAIEEIQPELKAGNCQIRSEIQTNVQAQIDAEKIKETLLHLLRNAMKFGRGAPIDLTLTTDSTHWMITVTDRGIGMSPETVTTLFLPFERASSSRNFPGLGLGLFISKEVLRAHGGTIEVQTQKESGARFILRAPLQPKTAHEPITQS